MNDHFRPTAIRRQKIWMALAAAAIQIAAAQDQLSVRDLRLKFEALYKNEQVSLRGWVNTERRVPSKTYRGFYLKDRYGDIILIRTTDSLPDITSEVQVTGVALRDADTNEVYVSEKRREAVAISPPSAIAAPPSNQPAESTRNRAMSQVAETQEEKREQHNAGDVEQQKQLYLLGGIGVAIVVLVIAAIYLLRRKSAISDVQMPPAPSFPTQSQSPQGQAESVGAVSTAATRPMEVENYKTVRVFKTTKVLPGRLVILEGGKETDTIHLTDQNGRGEVEIGRDSPDAQGGIRIKDHTNTLSRYQARLSFSANSREFKLTNLARASSNPTCLNGREMTPDETVTLTNSDLLRMGNIELKFFSR